MNGARGRVKKGVKTGTKRGRRVIKSPPPRGIKRGAGSSKKRGQVSTNCHQLRRLYFRQRVASDTTKRRKSDCSTAAIRRGERDGDRLSRRGSRNTRYVPLVEPVGKTVKSDRNPDHLIQARNLRSNGRNGRAERFIDRKQNAAPERNDSPKRRVKPHCRS